MTERLTDKNFRLGFDDSNKLPSYEAIYERLRKYETAEDEGRLVALPCKVGDTVYLPNKYVGIIITFNIVEFCMFKDEYAIIDDSDNEYKIEDFGKTVFLTREEAEKELREMEEKQDE